MMSKIRIKEKEKCEETDELERNQQNLLGLFSKFVISQTRYDPNSSYGCRGLTM